jgi:hypothetical protein
MSVLFEGKEYHFYGTVSFVAADNLGAHAIGRYFENFSTALRICRFCTATRQEIQHVSTDVNFTPREKATFDANARDAEADETLRPVYGLKGTPSLHQLQYYHVVNGLPSDIAHDLFEGVVPETILKILKALVNEQIFTFELINDKINNLTYSSVDIGNKPPPIMLASNGIPRMKYSQSQMWCLARLLPIMIGMHIQEDNPYWNLFILLLDVVENVCAPQYSRGDIGYMRGVIQAFYESLIDLFPDERTKPKLHYVTHYPNQTLLFGPLIHCWTIRLEGKHEFFKQIFHRTKNRKNICKTLCVRHQTKQALIHTSPNLFEDVNTTSYAGAKTEFVQILDHNIQALLLPLLGDKELVTDVSSVIVDGIKYTHGACIVLGHDHDTYIFGEIVNIFIIEGQYKLCCQKLKTIEYQRHFHAYTVEESNVYVLTEGQNLLEQHPLGIYKVNNVRHVILKYHIPTQ